MLSKSWLLGKLHVMMAIGVIGCGYNDPYVKLVIHCGSFRSFVALHQKLGQLARDSQLGISRMIFSMKSRVEAMHIDSSFAQPNAWIMDMKNC